MMTDKVKIKIYGVGCAKCRKAEEIATDFFIEHDIHFEVKKVQDKEEILNSGVMVTPAVEINGEMLFHGRLPRNKDLEAWLQKIND